MVVGCGCHDVAEDPPRWNLELEVITTNCFRDDTVH